MANRAVHGDGCGLLNLFYSLFPIRILLFISTGASMLSLIFPGQGSQAVGMGKALADAFPASKAVFDEVDEALKQPLSKLIWEGPSDELTLTVNTQPALMAVSLAAFRALEVEAGFNLRRDAAFVAGHSLGEYSALAAAGVFSITDAARLLRIRGQAMQEAVPVGQGAMAALLGLDYGDVIAIVHEAGQGEICEAANDNGGGQVVISGHKAAVERAIILAQQKGAKRAILLPVSAPFHCALMKPAAKVMQDALASVIFHAPLVPVITNVEAMPVHDAEALRSGLVAQVTGSVRWRESVLRLVHEGVDSFIEVGAGKILSGLVKRIATGASCTAIGTPDDVNTFKKG
jgi:[acyl-carrier-protein] S-malonyltransferase